MGVALISEDKQEAADVGRNQAGAGLAGFLMWSIALAVTAFALLLFVTSTAYLVIGVVGAFAVLLLVLAARFS